MTTAKKDAIIRDDYADSRSTDLDGSGGRFSELVDHLLKNGYLTDSQVEYAPVPPIVRRFAWKQDVFEWLL